MMAARHPAHISQIMQCPSLLYGTAWKKDKTVALVRLALQSGFRAIDTANQRKHYREDLVGEAIAASGLPRSCLFLQSKFTPMDGQDAAGPLPYSPASSLEEQVAASAASSLLHLRTSYLDSLLLHSFIGAQDTLRVWRAFEALVDAGSVRALGISNCYSPKEFAALYAAARIKPSFLQNRFYSDSGYDAELRSFCKAHSILYQSFWSLTANPELLSSAPVAALAGRHKGTAAQALFRLLVQLGISPLTGTSSEAHMLQDLAALQWPESPPEELRAFEELLLG